MSRRKLDRYSVPLPSAEALAACYRLYDGHTLHHCPDALPALASPALFGNAHPLALDVGCGRGEFTLQYAQEYPDRNVLGIDFHRKSLYDAVNKASQLLLKNICFVKADVRQVMGKIPAESIAAIFLLFPPPVVQKKHLKKDLLTPRFIEELARILAAEGTLTLVTDHRAYFACKVELLDRCFTRSHTTEGFEGGITRYQRIWERHGLPSLRAEYVKRRDE
jgi:tRNA (guanine-N(7)-)-methyltransferase